MNEDKFTGKADFYAKFRPSYPNELIDYLYEKTQAKSVADIGAGTGIFTKCLCGKDWEITAVEPNCDMREKAYATLPQRVKIISANAENTLLPANSTELITVAQAFHWFDENLFKAECKRILADNGYLAIVWNGRTDCDFSRARNEVCKKFCGMFHRGHTGKRSEADGDVFLRNEYFSNVEFSTYTNDKFLTQEEFIGDTLSRSYSLNKNDENYDSFVNELKKVFQKYKTDDKVKLPYQTTCYLGKL